MSVAHRLARVMSSVRECGDPMHRPLKTILTAKRGKLLDERMLNAEAQTFYFASFL
jgi:hypothetical protein